MSHKEKVKIAAKLYHSMFPYKNFYLQNARKQAQWIDQIIEYQRIFNEM